MADEIPDETEIRRIRLIIVRAVGEERMSELLRDAVSIYGHANALTGAAHHTISESRRRVLQIEGGALVERFSGAG